MGLMLEGLGVRNVLIVDDDAHSAELVTAWAHGLGCATVQHARTRSEALEHVRERPPELVITEVLLPDGDCLRLVRAARGLQHTPWVLATSERATQDMVASVVKVGATYLDKPLAEVELSRVLANLVAGEARCRQLARSLVGSLGLKEAQDLLREEMYAEALDRCQGNRRAAARTLGVDRRCVQRQARS